MDGKKEEEVPLCPRRGNLHSSRGLCVVSSGLEESGGLLEQRFSAKGRVFYVFNQPSPELNIYAKRR